MATKIASGAAAGLLVLGMVLSLPSIAARSAPRVVVPFVPNEGQWDAPIAFSARTATGNAWITADGTMIHRVATQRSASAIVTETIVGRDGRSVALHPRGVSRGLAQVSYFVGDDPSRHRDGLPTYAELDLGRIAPSVEVRLRIGEAGLEKVFTVQPGGDPHDIRVRVDPEARLRVAADGSLVARTARGDVRLSPPSAWH